MSRTLATLILFAALAPAGALAQPTVDDTTGLSSETAGIGREKLFDYLKAVEAATTTITWDTAGDSRRELGANRMVFDFQWAWDEARGEPVVVGGEIRPAGGSKFFRLGSHKVYKLKINRKGEIKVEREGIDTTIYKMTKLANGDIELDIPWLHDIFADNVIPADTFGPFDITNWPPSLEEVVRTVTNRTKSDRHSTTRHEGTFRWQAVGNARKHRFPSRGGAVTAASRFELRGAGRLGPDGTFRTIGENNTAKLTLNVGGTRYVRENGTLSADLERGGGSFSGTYAISVPDGDSERFVMNVEGDVRYDVTSRNVILNVPSGARIVTGKTTLGGDGRLTAAFRRGGGDIKLSDGTYTMDLTGPLGVSGLDVSRFTLEDLRFDDVNLSSSGRVHELSSDGLEITGGWDGVLEGNARGAANALLDQDGGYIRGRIGPRTRVEVDIDRLDLESRFPGWGPTRRKRRYDINAEGKVRGSLDLVDARAGAGNWTIEAPAATTAFDLDVVADNTNGVTDASGHINTTVDESGTLAFEGLPGAPLLPAATTRRRPASRRHSVVSGDSINAIARRYGVSPAALRAANGMGPRDSLIRVGDVLLVPGGEAVPRPRPRPTATASTPTRWTSDLSPGSELRLDIDSARVGPDGVVVEGHAAVSVRVDSADVTSGDLRAKILGAAQASLAKTAFRLAPGPDGKYAVKVAEVKVPVRVDLRKGSRVSMDRRGNEMNVVIDHEGSYAEFTAVVTTGPDGRLQVPELQQVDLLLHSNGAAAFAGGVADAPGDKTVRYTGRMVFVERGIDFFGDLTVTVRGDATTPAVRIRW